MNVDLLNKLADMLDVDADNENGLKFDLGYIGVADSTKGRWDWQPALTCNTMGCAMGLAAISGEFPGLGYEQSTEEAEIWPTWKGHPFPYDDIACILFGIGLSDARRLFSPEYYKFEDRSGAKGERVVANRIRQLIDKGNLNDIFLCCLCE